MRRTNRNLMICAMIFGVSLVIANAITAKTIQTGIPLFGGTILVPCAVIAYPVTFLMTDVISELWGPKEARAVVLVGFGCQLLSLVYILVAQALPAGDTEMQGAYDMLLGQNIMFVIGSMVAYLLSQSWDVFVFHKIRGHFVKEGDGPSPKRWIWNNASTMTSQIIDTFVFIAIGFGVGFGWFFDPAMVPTVFAMMIGQYLIKLVIAAIDTPVFYILTRKGRTEWPAEEDEGTGRLSGAGAPDERAVASSSSAS